MTEKKKAENILELLSNKTILKLIQFFINNRRKNFVRSEIENEMNEETKLGDCTIYKHFDHLIENDIVVSKNYKYKEDKRKKSTYDYWTLNENSAIVQAIVELEKILEKRSDNKPKEKRLINELSKLDPDKLKKVISKAIEKKEKN